MINHPLAIVGVLLGIEAFILWMASHPKSKSLFNFLPSIFWIYFLPMVLSTIGLIDGKNPICGQITNLFLPGALFLLLLSVDIKAILRLGPCALAMFFSGGLGVVVGIVITFIIFKPWVGSSYWTGFASLAGSWTGGSANMIAVKEAFNTPDAVFLPMVIVDTIVPYVWMGILMASVGFQSKFDTWNHSNRAVLDQMAHSHLSTKKHQAMHGPTVVGFALLAVAAVCLTRWLSGFLPIVKDVISPYAWTIIMITSLAIALSFTPLRKHAVKGSSQFGYWVLYLVLAAIGAKASLNNMGTAGVLIGAGCLIILIHAAVLLVAARLLKAPLFLCVSASQANVGGVASAPMVSEVYQPGLSSVGLLMAILGNIVGTYAGILCGQILRLL